MANRVPLRTATYRGDATGCIGEVMGPTMLREHMVPIEAMFDPATNSTRVGFAFATLPDINAAMERQQAQARLRGEHPAFFKEA